MHEPPHAMRSPAGSADLSNVVFMGMGEPLANYNRLIPALRRIIEPNPAGLGLSRRSITVSTVGLVPAIGKLAEPDLGVTLAVSLHAPDDELRDTLVPVNTRWNVREVLAAADHYAETTGRRYSIEYAMIRNVNDQPWRAELLGDLLSTRLAHVNLIPLNPTPGSEWDASPKHVEREFVRLLEVRGVSVTVRDTRGSDIDGACGQLAAAHFRVTPRRDHHAQCLRLVPCLREAARLDRTQSDPAVALRNAVGVAAPLVIATLTGANVGRSRLRHRSPADRLRRSSRPVPAAGPAHAHHRAGCRASPAVLPCSPAAATSAQWHCCWSSRSAPASC